MRTLVEKFPDGYEGWEREEKTRLAISDTIEIDDSLRGQAYGGPFSSAITIHM